MTNLEFLKSLEGVKEQPRSISPVATSIGDVVDSLPKNLVMHVGTGVIGRVNKVHIRDPPSSMPTHVLEMEEGHTFTFKPDVDAGESEFTLVLPKEAHLFLMLVGSLDVVVKSSASLGKAMGLDLNKTRTILVAALERATRALKTLPRATDPT